MSSDKLTRRRVVKSLGAAGALGLAGCSGGGAKNDSGTVKVGAVLPLSGDLEYYGQQSLWGFYGGLSYKGAEEIPDDGSTGEKTIEVGDVTYEIIVRDGKFDAKTSQNAATDLISKDEVDVLYGGVSSNVAHRIIDTVIDLSDRPYLIAGAASSATTNTKEYCSERIFRATENAAMSGIAVGNYVGQSTDIESVYLFGADYAFGRSIVNNLKRVLKNNGVEILGERYVPIDHQAWGGLLDEAEAAGADGISYGGPATSTPALASSYLNGDYSYRFFGLFPTLTSASVMGNLLEQNIDGDLTPEKVRESGLGPYATWYHWNQFDNPINNEFTDTYVDTYGKPPDLWSGSNFTTASALHQAVTNAGSSTPGDIISQLRGMTVTDTPKGENAYEFQKYNNQARSPITVADATPTTQEWTDAGWNASVMLSEPIEELSKDEVTLKEDADEMTCSL